VKDISHFSSVLAAIHCASATIPTGIQGIDRPKGRKNTDFAALDPLSDTLARLLLSSGMKEAGEQKKMTL
jgi:hypothetical protein